MRRTSTLLGPAASVAACCALIVLPLLVGGYYLTLGVNLMLYAALCTAWVMFSGPTNLVSLASAAFFGIGTYVVAIGIGTLPFFLLVPMAGVVAGAVAGIVGIATLRLSGVYFVIFTLGLSELIRQIVAFAQSVISGKMGLYVLTNMGEADYYGMLVALTMVIFLVGALIARSRLGFALRVIGNDEVVARHFGIDTSRAKIILFTISGAFIGMAGAILAPRYAYVEPQSAFDPLVSFLVVIMALLGGTGRLWGPLVGVIPFTLLMDVISADFPNEVSIAVGLTFLAIVYALPRGVTGLLDDLRKHGGRRILRMTKVEEGA